MTGKNMIVTVLTLLLGLSFPLNAQAEENRYYIGAGGTYAFQDFGDVHGVKFNNAGGLNLKTGFRVTRNAGLELNFDYFSDFKADGNGSVSGVPVDIDAKISLYTFTVDLKVFLTEGVVNPYLLAGIGYMNGKINYETSSNGANMDNDWSESKGDGCGKVGAGLEFFMNEKLSVGLDGSYLLGFGALDSIRYYKITAGINFYLW